MTKIGFIGLGTMGLPIAKNIIKAGYETYVISRSRPPIEEAVSYGAREAATPKALIEMVDILFTCLPNPQTNNEIYYGTEGIFAGASEGKIVIDLSTVKPDMSKLFNQQLALKGADFLDAPISGGRTSAQAGTLTIMCGGEKHVFEKVYDVLKVFGDYVVHVGPAGSGSVVKLINNMLISIHAMALSEAYALADKANLHPRLMLDIVKRSSGYSKVMDLETNVEVGRRKTQVNLHYLNKDIGLALSYANDLGLSLELAELTQSLIRKEL